jgi:dihydroorotate dehydrogenase (NAD+) catalytic subunit
MIVKLTPNVTDVKEFAKLAESEGADAISLINTLKGISVDIYKMKPNLANVTGGLSGPAIKPIALRMVAECAACVKIPIIGMGGIMNHEDALEFIMVGASLIAVGTANMVDPMAAVKIKDGIKMFLEENGFSSIAQIRGKIKI